MMSLITVSAAFLLLHVSSVSGALTEPVKTAFGPIRGSIETYDGTTVHVFKGIPYAAPPVGDLRFAPPQPPLPWTEPLETAEYKSRCVANPAQDTSFYYPPREPAPMDEDCLHLTVVVPQTESPKPMAVMVYIHAGSLTYGSSEDFQPEALAVAGDVIVVAINYRLNVFGFLASGDDSAPGNVGFLDQVLALKWVNWNIAMFGGDVGKITIFGVSAGAWSVSAHMVSPLSGRLFTRAISQSGTFYGYALDSRQERAEKTKQLAKTMGCSSRKESSMLSCLRKKPARELHDAALSTYYLPWSVATYGDEFLPYSVTDMYNRRKIHSDKEYMVGVCSEEGGLIGMLLGMDMGGPNALMYNGDPKDGPVQNFILDFVMNTLLSISDPEISDPVRKMIKEKYYANQESNIGNLRSSLNLLGDVMFVGPAAGAAEKTVATGNDVYFYWNAQAPDTPMPNNFPQYHVGGLAAPELGFGAAHGYDLFYVFAQGLVAEAPGSLVDVLPEEDKVISRSVVHAVTEFAKSGVPSYLKSNGEMESWPKFTASDKKYLTWKYPMKDDSIKENLLPDRMHFWNDEIPAFIKSLTDPPKDEL